MRYPNAGRGMTEFAITNEGDRVAVVARGEIFSVPVEKGVTLPVTRGTGAREKSVMFDPKGEKLFYLTDETRRGGDPFHRRLGAWRGRDHPARSRGGVALPARSVP